MIQDAAQSATPDIFATALPAIIGFGGVMLGGLLQVIAKHRADRYAHMMELRSGVAELALAVSGFATMIVQSATWIDKVRAELEESLKSDPDAKPEIDDDYNERLADRMTECYRSSAERSVKLLVAGDERIASKVGSIQLRLADVINEVGYMHTGSVYISSDRAKEIQKDVMDLINVLVNMVAPHRWERFWNFRSAKRAKIILEKERKKATADGFNVG